MSWAGWMPPSTLLRCRCQPLLLFTLEFWVGWPKDHSSSNTNFFPHSGDTVYAWKTWTVMWYSSGSGTGGYSVSRGPWKQFEDEGWWAGNRCYPRSSLHSSIAAMSLCKLPVGICGAHFVLRDLMAPTLMFGSHPSPWKAIRTRRHHPQAFTGRPAEALVGPYEQQLSTQHCCRTLNLSHYGILFFFFFWREMVTFLGRPT